MNMKKIKNILMMMMAFALSVAVNFQFYEIKAEQLEHYRISTHDLALHVSQTYNPAHSFDALIITKVDGTIEYKDYEQFLLMGGTVETTVGQTQTSGEYRTTYSINGVSEDARILIIDDEVSVDYDLKDIDQLAHQAFDVNDSFNKITVTLNGIKTTYNTVEEFQAAGGIVDDSMIPSPLKAGIYPLKYSIYEESHYVEVRISSYRISTHDLTLHESQVYNPKDSFDALEITHPDKGKERKTYEEFLEMGGEVKTTVLDAQKPGVYETTYTLDQISEQAKIMIIEDDVVVDFHLNDVSQSAHEPFILEDTFQKVTVTLNGISTSFDTLEAFENAGGIVNTQMLPTPLKAGIYPVEYSIYNNSDIAYLKITEYNIEFNELSIKSIEDFEAQDSFAFLSITHPDLTVEILEYDNFLLEGGTVSITQVDETLYLVTYSLGGFERSTEVNIVTPRFVGLTLDYQYDDKIEHLTVEVGSELLLPQVEDRSGYIFLGWYKDNLTFDQAFDFNETLSEDTVLYAKWEKNTSPVRGDSAVNNDAQTGLNNTSKDLDDQKMSPHTGVDNHFITYTILMVIGMTLMVCSVLKKKKITK